MEKIIEIKNTETGNIYSETIRRVHLKKDNKVYIIGHKNPDTDSICSAIAYADIKNRTEKKTYVAKRAGQINEETEFVLKYFQIGRAHV